MRRADFIPAVIWVRQDDGWMVPLHQSDDPERWLALVNSDEPIIIQADDGTDEYDGKGIIPTSSSSAPGVIRRMLDQLDVHPGMTVLEIGTGTGYNAALLAERAAPGHVISIEVDHGIADHAQQTLAKTAGNVSVVTGEGALGYPERAPYHRVIATASARQVPYAWVAQTRPGGRILLPLDGSFNRQAFVCLTADDNGAAHGRFSAEAAFMSLRDQRNEPAVWWDHTDNLHITKTRLLPREAFDEFDAGFVLGVALPGLVSGQRTQQDGTKILQLSHFASGSWASLAIDTNEHEVIQHGPRRLWNDLEAAYEWWTDADRPDHTRIGITVTPDGQTFWLDTPGHTVPSMQGSAV